MTSEFIPDTKPLLGFFYGYVIIKVCVCVSKTALCPLSLPFPIVIVLKKIKSEDNIKLTHLLTAFWIICSESKPRF